MAAAILVSFLCLMILSLVAEPPADGEMAISTIVWILAAFFMLSFAIALVAVISGIGGGVIFSPVMLAFTDVSSLVVRATGLIVAMISGPIAAGVFTKKGLAHYRLNLVVVLSQGLGALIGATLAVFTAAESGITGEGFLRFGLGLIILALAVFFLFSGKKTEVSKLIEADRFTKCLKLDWEYYDERECKSIDYRARRAPLGIALTFLVGIMGGFFGMGGGWAITPILNLGMGLPLRVAAANSNIILGLSGGISIWPYIFAGGIIPLFVLPWIAGQVAGGFVGSHVLARLKVELVRLILIGVMIFTSFALATRGLELLGLIAPIPAALQVAVFVATMAGIGLLIAVGRTKGRNTDA